MRLVLQSKIDECYAPLAENLYRLVESWKETDWGKNAESLQELFNLYYGLKPEGSQIFYEPEFWVYVFKGQLNK
ncbi:MAG: hypothetical protein Tsb0021_04340 [Chlamydiales bacterium]